MHIAIIFVSIGPYHAARLRAAARACGERQWNVTAVQVVESTTQHPWGAIYNGDESYPVQTLLHSTEVVDSADETPLKDAAAERITACLNELQADTVVIPGWGGQLERRALAWARRTRKHAIVMSESKRDDAKRQWWKEKIKARFYVSKFDAGLVGGAMHRDYLVELGLPKDKIFTGYDVVDNDYFWSSAEAARRNEAQTRKHDSRIPARPYFLATTRFIKRKNIPRLIEAYAGYRKKVDQPWDLVVCGSGEEEENIRRRIAQEKLNEFVHLPGFLKYTEVGAWYGLANAFVHPALQEQWGLVVNEACAAGLAVLCSRTVGARYELVKTDRNGLLFDPESCSDMTRALTEMHSFDDTKRRVMGEEGRKIVADFHPQRFGDGLVCAIDAALRKNI